MNTQRTPLSLRIKVGISTLLGLFLIAAVTVYVNDRPFWWRPCQLVHINVEDATGLKTRSPIRSLGLQIGYLESVDLFETYVRLGICITAPVEVLPSTRAYIRGEGFLGDKFVELKPVRYVGSRREVEEEEVPSSAPTPTPSPTPRSRRAAFLDRALNGLSELLIGPSAYAQTGGRRDRGDRPARDIPVGQSPQDVQRLVEQVDDLVGQMRDLTGNLKEAIDPSEMRRTMQQLNRTLEAASRTLSPAGGLNTTAQRTLEKLEDGIEQLRDIIARVNKGEGSVGMLLNDPVYAQEIRESIRSLNAVINRLARVRINVDLAAHQVGEVGGRGYLMLNIWASPQRYYRLGVTSDPRGAFRVVDYTTTVGGTTTQVRTIQSEQGGLVLTAQVGRLFWHRLDLSIGLLHGDGAVSAAFLLGPTNRENMFRFQADTYTRGRGQPVDERLILYVQPFLDSPILNSLYVHAGLESIRRIDGHWGYIYGAGITFDDEDLRVLFAFR